MNNRPPPRRGLGRGLGSLIPTGPLATEPRHSNRDGHEVTTQAEADPTAPQDRAGEEPVTADAPAVASARSAAPADWIGRIPAPTRPDDLRDDVPDHVPDHLPAAALGPAQADAHTEVGPASSGARPQPPTDDLPTDTRISGLTPVAGAHFAELPLASITPNPRQPRQVFDEDAMAELVHSIREVGLLQPVVVRSLGEDRYELIMGERRLRATREAGLDSIPAIVRDTGDDAMLRDALLENLHRAQLNPLEEAAAYQQLLDDFGCTHDDLATRIGRSRPQISNTLRLLKLSPAVQRRVAAGVLSAGHARTLLAVPEAAAQDRLAARVVAEGISVRGLEELVTVGELGAAEPQVRRRARAGHPELGELMGRLSDRFDTRVKVDMGRNKGRLTIEFASLEDLRRIVGLMEATTAGAADDTGGGSAKNRVAQ